MKILAMETSTALGGVAVLVNGQVVAEESSLRQKSHSEVLSPFIENCLHKADLTLEDIDVFAVGQGPGSFTGIRVAANAGKTFSYCYNKPLVTIDSLMLLAHSALGSSRPVLAILNAFKNMVYLGVFDVSHAEPVYIKGPLAVPVRELKNLIQDECLTVGDGWSAYHQYLSDDLKNKLIRDSNISDHPLAGNLGRLAHNRAQSGQTLDWKSFVPLYIRASEAEEHKKGIFISPLE